MGPLSLRASCTHTRVRCTRFHLEAEWPTDRQLENRVASALQQYARRDPEARETLAASRLTQSPSVLDSNERLDARSVFESSQVLRTGISHPADDRQVVSSRAYRSYNLAPHAIPRTGEPAAGRGGDAKGWRGKRASGRQPRPKRR